MPDFTVDENGVVYDNRPEPVGVDSRQKPHAQKEAFTGSWWVPLILSLWLALISTAVFADRPFPMVENCSGPNCLVVPTIFLVIFSALCACFIFSPALAQEFKGFRYLTSALLFLILIDYGLAGTLNWWYEGSHYVVETINKSTSHILRTTEPSNSTFFSLTYVLSPLPLFVPDLIRFARRGRRQ
jgi:hypothetical protein